MANEATIRISLQIRNGNLQYQNQPTGFSATQTTPKGPSPGAFTVTTLGTDVDFSKLTQPTLCVIKNLDVTNFVTFGIYDPSLLRMFPLGEVLPGESYLLRLSRYMLEEFSGQGTGTDLAQANTLRILANTASCVVSVEAFEA